MMFEDSVDQALYYALVTCAVGGSLAVAALGLFLLR
jgi:Flp pilus assembly protein protease CpaA